ncbi:MAG: hypothetical protein NTZ61_00725 [Proteobacteria bacterium]|nr:hypothetical protein [Pseudomonadota bacterium]
MPGGHPVVQPRDELVPVPARGSSVRGGHQPIAGALGNAREKREDRLGEFAQLRGRSTVLVQPTACTRGVEQPSALKEALVLRGGFGRELRRDPIEQRTEALPRRAELSGQPRRAVDGGLRERGDHLVALVEQQREQIIAELLLSRVLARALHDRGEERVPDLRGFFARERGRRIGRRRTLLLLLEAAQQLGQIGGLAGQIGGLAGRSQRENPEQANRDGGDQAPNYFSAPIGSGHDAHCDPPPLGGRHG